MEDCSKNLQTDMRKEFYNANVQILLKKQYKSLFNIFCKASVVERFVEKRYVEIIYAQMEIING